MIRSAKARRTWRGPVLLSCGFRPFFLGAAAWAAIGIALWMPFYVGEIEIPTALAPVSWHAHEMIYGYGSAVVAGFLLTAIPNWTGRLPVAGWPLAALAALWAAGRIAVLASAMIGWRAAAVIDVAFLAVFAAVAVREVVAGRNRRNLKVVALLLGLAGANAAFHVEAATAGAAVVSTRVGLALIVFMILLIGGRVVPSFTSNWLAKRGEEALPAPFGRADGAVMALSATALGLWVVDPGQGVAGATLLLAAAGNAWRLSRWRGWSTRSDRLVLVLHAGFLFAVLGFVFAGAGSLWPDLVPSAAGIHVWAVGAIGTMTLAIMTRASLGHTGRALRASGLTQLLYSAVAVAAAARGAMIFLPGAALPLMSIAGAAWIAAFGGFVAAYGPMLLEWPRRSAP
ncbi:NnrS family protein [Inquilinus sp. OTU3971]|uniref:NnrS family protein n=1 Tax=Inquilinus sp. OTU3971 TaxID=3043855 RepID=UPI00313D1D1D